jgi:hypothetical protein
LLFRVNLRDTQTGLKVMRREVADRVIQVALVKRLTRSPNRAAWGYPHGVADAVC